jgi:hypothetical protein
MLDVHGWGKLVPQFKRLPEKLLTKKKGNLVIK